MFQWSKNIGRGHINTVIETATPISSLDLESFSLINFGASQHNLPEIIHKVIKVLGLIDVSEPKYKFNELEHFASLDIKPESIERCNTYFSKMDKRKLFRTFRCLCANKNL